MVVIKVTDSQKAVDRVKEAHGREGKHIYERFHIYIQSHFHVLFVPPNPSTFVDERILYISTTDVDFEVLLIEYSDTIIYNAPCLMSLTYWYSKLTEVL